MENSRRPFDRSRDPGLMKKPRLSEESIRPVNSNSRQFSNQRTLGTAVAAPPPVSSRFRVGGRETETNIASDPSREAYLPQPVHPHYELVNQYKTALAELTFNSKPIITNLTIIAGENVHAAKAVVATICNNILEVPSDQKLPTLYLLDSIVKNIGRDYIKYFGAKLPEVFVKAYRQVDPPMHNNMRHLFGTWKGVFHPQTLQLIEKELGFNARSDGSAAVVTTGRADPPSQRPAHSIHVNPKYLERQRLQQSGRTKAMITDIPEISTNLTRDSDRLERVSSIATGGSWVDPAKVNTIRRPQRDSLSEPLYEKDTESIPGEYDYASDLPHSSRSMIKKGSEKQWYGAMSRSPDLISDQRDELQTKGRISNYASATESSGPSRNIGVPYDSWKHSEEEEFMWDMHSRLTETDVATINPKNEVHALDESERLESENHLLKQPRFPALDSRFDSANSYSSEQKDPSMFGRWSSSPSSLHDSEAFPSIGATSNPARKGIQHQSRVAGSGILPNSGSVSDKQSSLHDSTSKQYVTKQDVRRAHSLPQRDPRASRFPAKSKNVPQDDSVRLPSQGENFEYKETAENATCTTGKPSMSDLLEGFMKSGILSKNSIRGSIKEENPQDEVHPAVSKPQTAPLEQASKENSKDSDPLTNLLSSLVCKGLIIPPRATSKTEPTSLAQDHSPDHSTNSSMSVSVVQSTAPAPKAKGLAAPFETEKLEPEENLIGLKFRADKIRELHPSVISSLFDDLPHLCTCCGTRFKHKEELDKHMEMHDKQKLELSSGNGKCRVRFPKTDDWIASKSGELCPEYEEVLSEPEDGPAVAADENQCACILCGEIFEDYFSQEMSKWMFKGASYLTIPSDNSETNGPIVHEVCLSKQSLRCLEVGNAIKQEIVE